MNRKLCKELRGKAAGRTIGMLPRAWVHGRGLMYVNSMHTTRGVYRALKKAERAK